ncbi:MAG: hypothetical protein AMXMBFR84_34260 [Candidatus Hydrogenedentota bacterium]
MNSYLKSVTTAFLIATLVMAVSIGVLGSAPTLPQVIGKPDVSSIKSVTHEGITQLVLSNTDGNISIATHDGDSVSVTADIRAFVKRSETVATANAYMETLMANTVDNGVLNVVTEPGSRPAGVYLFVLYTVQVPRGTDITVNAENGNVTLNEGCGRVEVRGHNTDIDIARPLGEVTAESINGRIRLAGAPAGGHLSTVNGNVEADVEGGFLEASTANGLIFAKLLKPVIDGCRLTSQNGGIRLHMKEGSSASIDARTGRGNIYTDLPLTPAQDGEPHRQVQGTIGSGSGSERARIEMDALNGNIIIASTGI